MFNLAIKNVFSFSLLHRKEVLPRNWTIQKNLIYFWLVKSLHNFCIFPPSHSWTVFSLHIYIYTHMHNHHFHSMLFSLLKLKFPNTCNLSKIHTTIFLCLYFWFPFSWTHIQKPVIDTPDLGTSFFSLLSLFLCHHVFCFSFL